MIFLVQTPHPWRGIRQRSHHLLSRFARQGHFVRWVEPRYLRWLLESAEEFHRARQEEPEANIQVRPVTLINGERLPPVRACNEYRLARALRKNPPPGAEGPRVLWLYNPHEAHLADRVPHDLLIYDIMDEYQGFPWSPPNVTEEERTLLRRADWVFAGTRALLGAKGEWAEGKIECVLSGVETDRFANPDSGGSGAREAIGALRRRHKKLIGYAGMVDLRVDQALLAEAARRFPDWGFVILGPLATDVAALKSQPNIHLLDRQPYEDLPAWYHAWDAALLPFVENELTRHINPTKMLEYAAAGRPIVARSLPDVRECYADGAWLYEKPEEFLAHLETISRADPQAIEPRLAVARAWARERDWDTLAERMLERVSSLQIM